ncbi:MAG TPA: SpoIIE family protein phosphatase [Solirubrobacteraceae bacterium]
MSLAEVNGPTTEQALALARMPDGPSGKLAPASTSILLVDDDEKSIRALRAVLEPLGQRLVAASSGEEGLRRLLHEEFAVILLDVRMSGLDGLETARYIKARARTRHVPIVFLTAQAEDVEQAFRAYAAGAVDYVVKPFDPDVLRSKVAVFVELQRERSERVREAQARAEAEAVASTVNKLQSVSDAALAHLEIDELLPEILERAITVFDAHAGGLLLGEESSSELTLMASRGLELAEPVSVTSGEELFETALRGSPLNAPDLSAAKRLPPALSANGMRSLIAAPLSAGSQQIGVLFICSREPHGFSDDDVNLLLLSAERAAVAIQHARAYEREHGMVEALQRHLLPDRLPKAPTLALAARYRPSEHAAQVGGDWYDAIALPGGLVGLVIGDVVGRGIRAATMMSELRAGLRAYAVAEPQCPALAVDRLNSLVVRTHGGMVATLLYMVFNIDTVGVRYASAGHLPPLVMTPEGETHFLEHPPAPPLGAAPHPNFEDHEGELPPDSTMLLYTDGLVERRGENLDVGLEHLREVLGSAPADLEDLCSHILVGASAQGAIQDDVALLAVRRLPVGVERLEIELAAEPDAVPLARHRVERWLTDAGLGRDDAFAVKLALSEACTNAVEHAYGPEPGRTFRVSVERHQGAIVIEVSDAGRWRSRRGRDQGRGIHIIEQVMDAVDIKRTSMGTSVTMRRETTPR